MTVNWPSSPEVAACLITLGGVEKSPLTSALPARIFLPAETVSAKPPWNVMSSRYAGRKSASEAFQFGLRTRWINLLGVYSSTMYGPVET